MNQTQAITTGSCLCGHVRYQITAHPGIFQYCHGSRWRKFTGSAFAANLLTSPKDFHWPKGGELVGRYELTEAKHFATGFCKNCSSSLPWLSQSGKAVITPAGTLDEDPRIRPSQNIFSASQAEWYEEPHKLPKHNSLPNKR
jgi:hypothetical protein